jgi:hypothetical protein
VSDSDDRVFGDRIARLWWAAPATIVAIGAIGASIVIAPTLGTRAGVPSGLSVPLRPTATARPTASVLSPAATRHRHKATPTPTPSVVSTSPPASIVVPQRPLVSSSPDDRYDDNGRQRTRDR